MNDQNYNGENYSYVPATENNNYTQNNDFNFSEPMNKIEYELNRADQANYILKWGIISLVLADTGILSFLGIYFSTKVKAAVTQYIETYGSHCAKTRIGNILSKVAFILGIVLTIYVAVCITIALAYIAIVLLFAFIGLMLGG